MFKRYFFSVFFDAPGDPAGGGPAGGGTGAPAPSPSPSPTPSPSPAPAPASAGAPSGTPAPGPGAAGAGTPPPQRYSFDEDRSQWIPPHRLAEERRRAAQLEGQYRALEARTRALMGLEQPTAPMDPRQQEVRKAFLEMFPEFKAIAENPDVLQRVLQMAGQGGFDGMRQTEQAYWRRHATSQADQAVDALAKKIGVERGKLHKNAQAAMAREMMHFISADPTGERQQRFEMGDPKLIEEVVAEVAEMWVNPFRVQENNDAARLAEGNRRLPQRGPAGAPPVQAAGGSGNKRDPKEVRKAAREFVRQNLGT